MKLFRLAGTAALFLAAVGLATFLTHRFDEGAWPFHRQAAKAALLTVDQYSKLSTEELKRRLLVQFGDDVDFVGRQDLGTYPFGIGPAVGEVILSLRPHAGGFPGLCIGQSLTIDLIDEPVAGAPAGTLRTGPITTSRKFGVAGELAPDTSKIDQPVLEARCASRSSPVPMFFTTGGEDVAWTAAGVLTAALRIQPGDGARLVCQNDDGSPCRDGYAELRKLHMADLALAEETPCPAPRRCFRMKLVPKGLPRDAVWNLEVKARFGRTSPGGWGRPQAESVVLHYSEPLPI